MKTKVCALLFINFVFLNACRNGVKMQQTKGNDSAQAFLDQYSSAFIKLYTSATEAQWQSQICIREGDTTLAAAQQQADEAMAEFTGSVAVIESTKSFLNDSSSLNHLQKKQLQKILFLAANNPQTVADIVKKRIKAESDQVQKLYGFQYVLNGKKVSTGDIDEILRTNKNPEERLAAWSASKEVGKELRPGLLVLRQGRNETVQSLGYADYFSYQVSEYGMSTDEMMLTMESLLKELWPLYRELHTYMRYQLASDYHVMEVPDLLPAHWLPNRWGQDWSSSIPVKGINLDSILGKKSAEWIVREGEKLYTSIGFSPLPQSFWEKSSLYPYPADSMVKKNNHASAWHMNLQDDVRSLMSVQPDAEWWETANHELGHIYYYMAYSTDSIPLLLREGANRAYHEAIGSMMGLAAMQKPYLIGRGLLDAGVYTDSIQLLLKEAMNTVVFMFFSSGTMSHWEKEFYTDSLSEDRLNQRWWELTKKYQGIAPNDIRDEKYCDPATKTHINDDAAQYYDYALSYVLLYQIHHHIATTLLKQDPRATNYYGHKEIGEFLFSILKLGGTQDWRQVLKTSTGQELNAKAMLDYFEPLYHWLKEQNKDKTYTLPAHL